MFHHTAVYLKNCFRKAAGFPSTFEFFSSLKSTVRDGLFLCKRAQIFSHFRVLRERKKVQLGSFLIGDVEKVAGWETVAVPVYYWVCDSQGVPNKVPGLQLLNGSGASLRLHSKW